MRPRHRRATAGSCARARTQTSAQAKRNYGWVRSSSAERALEGGGGEGGGGDGGGEGGGGVGGGGVGGGGEGGGGEGGGGEGGGGEGEVRTKIRIAE